MYKKISTLWNLKFYYYCESLYALLKIIVNLIPLIEFLLGVSQKLKLVLGGFGETFSQKTLEKEIEEKRWEVSKENSLLS